MNIKILLPARLIPIGSNVTKRTGEKVYTIKNEIRFFGGEDKFPTIRSDKDTRFLVADNSIVVVSGETELLWEVDSDTLKCYLHDIEFLIFGRK